MLQKTVFDFGFSLKQIFLILTVLCQFTAVAQNTKNGDLEKEKLFSNIQSYLENNRLIGFRDDDIGLLDSLSSYTSKVENLNIPTQEVSEYTSILKALEFFHKYLVKKEHTKETYLFGQEYLRVTRNDDLSYKVRKAMLPIGMRLHLGEEDDYLLQLFEDIINYQNKHILASTDADFVYYFKGYYLYELQKFDEALHSFEQIRSPEYQAMKVSFRIIYYFTIKEYEKGIAYYNANVDNPNFDKIDQFEIKDQLALSLNMIQDYQTAIELFENDLTYLYEEESDETITLKYRISDSYIGAQEYQKARVLLEYIFDNKKVKETYPQVYDYSLMSLLKVYVKMLDTKEFDKFEQKVEDLINFYETNSLVGVKIRLLKAEHLYNKEQFEEAYEIVKGLVPYFDKIRNSSTFKEEGYALLSKITLSLSKEEESKFYKNAYQEVIKENYEAEKTKSEISKEILSSNYKRKIAKQEADIANINLRLERTKKKRDITIVIIVSVILVLSIIMVIVLLGRRKLQSAFSEVKREKLSVDILLGEREKLLAYVSHQSKVPMVNMKYMLDMIENVRDMSSEEVEFMTKSVKYSLNNVDAQMKDILNWSKLVLNKRIEINKENLYEMVHELIEENRFLAGQKNIMILNSIGKDIFINTNKLALKTIISNLLVNAIKYSDKNSEVTVSFDKNSVAIQDSAKALSEEKKNLLLTKQQPITAESNQKNQMITSSGLGLFIAKDLCEKLNYQLDIKNKGNNTFLIIL